MTDVEFPRTVRVRPAPPEHLAIEANEQERAALADRFGIVAVHALRADVILAAHGDAVAAHGTMTADVTQLCAVSGEDFPVRIAEPVSLRFVREATPFTGEDEAELPGDEPDEIEFDGETLDLGEAIAQTLGLAIDPYAEGPGAEAARREAGLLDEDTPTGPLAEALAKLKGN